MKEAYRHKGLRKELIVDLRRKGITDSEILSAFDNIPRHFFFKNNLKAA